MKTHRAKDSWGSRLLLAVALLSLLLHPATTGAASISWKVANGSGWWDISSNWSLNRQPQGGDDVYLTQSGTNNIEVRYRSTLSPTPVLNSLFIDATGTGTITLNQGYDGTAYSLSSLGEVIGTSGKGKHIQSLGTNTVTGTLRLGQNNTAIGTYELSGGSLSSPDLVIGYYGTGHFIQTGGSNTIATTISLGLLGTSSVGTYDLSGSGVLSAGLSEFVGYQGNGTFTQSGGSNTLTAYNGQVGKLYVGSYTTSGKSGTYNLQNGNLTAPEVYIGSFTSGGSGTVNQSGGSNATGLLSVGLTGSASNGTYNLSGGALGATTINLNTNGTFNQTGGTLNAATFNHYGGTVTGSLENRGTYNYTSGAFSGRLLNYGSASLGTSFTAGDGLRQDVAAAALNIATGRTVSLNGAGLDNRGVINLSGGSLDGSGVKTNNGTLSGYGAISGSGALDNYGVVNLGGGAATVSTGVTNRAAGQLNIGSGGAVTFTGPVTNYGQVKTTGATVTWGGDFRNYGGYVSDPSMHYFSNNLYVEQAGYLVGGAGDLFSISGSFINYSLNNGRWSTLLADLAFTGGGYHQFSVTGADLGQNMAGYDANFAWNRLDLTGQSLTLLDGDGSQAGGALYVRKILGLTLAGSSVTNLTATDVNIYYDRTAAGNSYLGGLSYDLSGGGHLLAANPVPAPSTLLLLGSGLLGLGLLRRKWSLRK
jgi:hypothetical protein